MPNIDNLPQLSIPGATPLGATQSLPPIPATLPRLGAAPIRTLAPRPPQVGETIEGHTYTGGDPGDPKSWKPASGDDFLNSLPVDDTTKALVRSRAMSG